MKLLFYISMILKDAVDMVLFKLCIFTNLVHFLKFFSEKSSSKFLHFQENITFSFVSTNFKLVNSLIVWELFHSEMRELQEEGWKVGYNWLKDNSSVSSNEIENWNLNWVSCHFLFEYQAKVVSQ